MSRDGRTPDLGGLDPPNHMKLQARAPLVERVSPTPRHLVVPDMLAQRRAAESMGLAPGATLRQPQPPVPTYRPLAGLPAMKRGNTIVVDTTAFGSVPAAGGTPSFAQMTVVEGRASSGGDDAEAIAITLGYGLSVLPPSGSNRFDSRVTAQITWGVGGASFTALADWMNGTTIAVLANFVRVVALNPDNSAFLPATSIPLIQLSAGLAYGAPPATRQRATYTVATGTVTAGSSATVAIPAFATSFGVICSSAGTTPLELVQKDVTNNATNVQARHVWESTSNATNQLCDSIPILHGAGQLTLTNTSGTSGKFFVVFGLAL